MGRSSSSSCLSFVACGKGSAENNDMEGAEEMKGPSDKRRWSFRKRSPRHRVLTNTVPLESPPCSGNKEIANDFAEQAHPTTLGKMPVPRKADDIFPLSPVVLSSKSADSDFVGSASNTESCPPESVVIVIQTAIRGCLAQEELNRLKSIIKLQATVRGHLVRRQAAGALRCVQAIIRMQALVRGHRVRSSEDGLAVQQKLDQMRRTDSRRVNNLENQECCVESNGLFMSTDKVLGSTFAHQILESTRRTKPICIIYDPMKPSSGWRWLERWMSLSAKGYPRSWNTQLMSDHQESMKKINLPDEVEASDGNVVSHRLEPLKAHVEKTDDSVTHLEGDEDLITIDTSGFAFHSCHSIEVSGESTNTGSKIEYPQPMAKGSDFTSTSSDQIRTSLQSMLDSLSSQAQSVPDHALPDPVPSLSIIDSIPPPPKTEVDSPIHSSKASVLQHQEAEGKKPLLVSRKSTNPAFAAAQSKFEELSSMSASGRMSTSNNFGVPPESRLGTISPRNSGVKVMETSQAGDVASYSQRFQKGTSECGTEISVSSTLDSPDMAEPEGGELEHVHGTLDNKDYGEHGTSIHELNNNHPISESLSTSKSVPCLPEEPKVAVMSSVDSAIAPIHADSSKSVNPVFHIKSVAGSVQQMCDSSQEGSPTSRATVPESHGTPSSQVSSGTHKGKADTNKSIHKRISSSASKGSPSNENHDLLEPSTAEHLPKDSKNSRRRNSFGSAKPVHVDVEKRSNSLPNYMQATESAKAKALISHSPKSSPDARDKDGYLKKRHSLPVGNGKQDSPRVQQSPSQTQPGAKGSSGQPPQEREWRR